MSSVCSDESLSLITLSGVAALGFSRALPYFTCCSSSVAVTIVRGSFPYLLAYCLIPWLFQDDKQHTCPVHHCVPSASSHSARQGGSALWTLTARMNGSHLWKWLYFRSREDAPKLSVLQGNIWKIGFSKGWCQWFQVQHEIIVCIKNNVHLKGPIIANKELKNMNCSFKCEVYK